MFNEAEYLGKSPDDVVADLQKKFPTFTVAKVPMGSMVTMDHKLTRYRVWYNPKTNLVSSITNG